MCVIVCVQCVTAVPLTIAQDVCVLVALIYPNVVCCKVSSLCLCQRFAFQWSVRQCRVPAAEHALMCDKIVYRGCPSDCCPSSVVVIELLVCK